MANSTDASGRRRVTTQVVRNGKLVNANVWGVERSEAASALGLGAQDLGEDLELVEYGDEVDNYDEPQFDDPYAGMSNDEMADKGLVRKGMTEQQTRAATAASLGGGGRIKKPSVEAAQPPQSSDPYGSERRRDAVRERREMKYEHMRQSEITTARLHARVGVREEASRAEVDSIADKKKSRFGRLFGN